MPWTIELDGLLGDHRRLGRVDRDAGGIRAPADGLEISRRGADLDGLVAVGVDVLGPGVDGGQGDLVGIDTGARHGDEAARLELPGDRPGAGQLAARLREHRATSAAVLLRLSVWASTRTATPPGP